MKSKLLIGAALVLSGGLVGCKTSSTCHSVGNPQSGNKTNGLKMSLSILRDDNQSNPGFEVSIQNLGTNDVCLNLGNLLANGKVMIPDKISLDVTDGRGKLEEFHFFDPKFAGISGRIDDYVVPLRSGSTYSLELRMDQFWSPAAHEFGLKFKPGRYEVSAQFEGGGAETSNADMSGIKLMGFWKGKLLSNIVVIVE